MNFILKLSAVAAIFAAAAVPNTTLGQSNCGRVAPNARQQKVTTPDSDSTVYRPSRDRLEDLPPVPTNYYSSDKAAPETKDRSDVASFRRNTPYLVPTNSPVPNSNEKVPVNPKSTPKSSGNSLTVAEKIQLRYSDPRVIRMLQQLTPSGAESLYTEVSDLIDERYLTPAGYGRRVGNSIDHLAQALDIPAFIEAAEVRGTPAEIARFKQDLQDLRDALKVRNTGDALATLRQVQLKAAESIDINPSAISLEFLYGATDSLDQYSMLLPPEKNGEQSVGLRDNVVGIGVEVEYSKSGLKILKLLPGGPAAQADLRRGDVITHVNGNDLKEMDLNRAVDLIVGPIGSQVEIQAARGGRTGRVTLTRQKIALHSVTESRMEDRTKGVAYIKLDQFAESTMDEMDNALMKLHQQGMQSLILDLRGNPGGLLTTAIALSDRFLPAGTIVSTRGRNREDNSIEKARFEKTWKIPLVVLVDRNSASASEIFAAAIQENGRGVIVGEKSYGKGTVQTLFPLQSFPAALRLTTAKFYSPKGREMAGAGVTPDVAVANDQEGNSGAMTNDMALSEGLRQVIDPKTKQMAQNFRRTGEVQNESNLAA